MDSLEVQVEHETCRTIHGTHLEGIFSQKNSTGLAGGVNRGQDPTEGFRRAGMFVRSYVTPWDPLYQL